MEIIAEGWELTKVGQKDAMQQGPEDYILLGPHIGLGVAVVDSST